MYDIEKKLSEYLNSDFHKGKGPLRDKLEMFIEDYRDVFENLFAENLVELDNEGKIKESLWSSESDDILCFEVPYITQRQVRFRK